MTLNVTVSAESSTPVITLAQTTSSPISVGVAKQGPPGPPGDSPAIAAGITVSGHRVIAADGSGMGIYADHSNTSALTIQGISKGAALSGNLVQLYTRGKVQWPVDTLTPDAPVYLGSTGFITQAPPTTGWLRQIGIALAADAILIDIWPAYWLGE